MVNIPGNTDVHERFDVLSISNRRTDADIYIEKCA